MIGLSLVKRLLMYLIAGILFGLLFTGMFFAVTGYGYIFGFFADAAITAVGFGLLLGLMFELCRKIFAVKFNKVRSEITQTNEVVFDSAAKRYEQDACLLPEIEGWLFLTDTNLIYKSRKPKFQSQDVTIPINSIRNVGKAKFGAIHIVTDDGDYKFIVDRQSKMLDLINTYSAK